MLVAGKSTQLSCYMVKRSGFQSRFQDVIWPFSSHVWTKIIQLAKKSYVTSTTEIVENKKCICSGKTYELHIAGIIFTVSQRHPNSNWRFTKYTDWRWTNGFLHQELVPMTRLQKVSEVENHPKWRDKLILETAPFPLNHHYGKGRVTKAPLYEITINRACVLVMEGHRRQGHRHNDTWPRHPPHSKESLGHTGDPPVILHKEGRKWHPPPVENGGLEHT